MDEKLKAALDKQATHEMEASIAYKALAMWCEDKDFDGYSEFFTQQSEEERAHADRFHSYMLERDELPLIGDISKPVAEFDSLLKVAEHALKLEKANTSGINAAYEIALECKDYATQIFLQGLISEQVEEEDWANSMVTLTKRSQCSGALVYMDRHINKILNKDK